MEPRQIFNMIKTEQSQTIAFVLSYLENDKAGPILGMFNQDLREEVIEKLGCRTYFTRDYQQGRQFSQ